MNPEFSTKYSAAKTINGMTSCAPGVGWVRNAAGASASNACDAIHMASAGAVAL